MISDNDKLTTKEKATIGIEALINLIPYVGGSLATVIFGSGNERRIKRLESFFLELSSQIREQGITFSKNLEANKEALAALVEELVEKIQREHSEKKRQYFKNFFISAFTSDDLNYDKAASFMRILSEITYIEVNLLKNLYSRMGHISYIRDIGVAPEDDYEQLSALYHLQNLGFIRSGFGSRGVNLVSNKPPILSNDLSLSPFGKEFVEYVLKDY